MTTIDREIKTKIEDVVQRMLRGDAKDYAAYASLVARYRVLTELDDFMTESRSVDNEGDVAPDAES